MFTKAKQNNVLPCSDDSILLVSDKHKTKTILFNKDFHPVCQRLAEKEDSVSLNLCGP